MRNWGRDTFIALKVWGVRKKTFHPNPRQTSLTDVGENLYAQSSNCTQRTLVSSAICRWPGSCCCSKSQVLGLRPTLVPQGCLLVTGHFQEAG